MKLGAASATAVGPAAASAAGCGGAGGANGALGQTQIDVRTFGRWFGRPNQLKI